MKKMIVLLALVMVLATSLVPENEVETILIKNGKDYIETLVQNGVYCRNIQDIGFENGILYLLDAHFCTVFVVDLKTAKLLRTLFTRGQGPMELSQPTGIKIKNNKVFVLDRGFRGIKICDLEGNPANEFKTNTSFGRLNLDVNDKEEIFVGEYTQKDNTYISVYTMKGEKVRTLAKIGSKHELDLQRSSYKIRLDNDGNIVILFYVTREIMKFDSNGNLLWEKKIKNKVLSKADHLNKDGVKRGKNETVHTSMSVFNFNISTKNNIIIGHAFGGCILDKNGNLTHLITFEPPDGLFFFAISSDQVLNIFGTQIMRLYDIKEDILK